MNQANHLVRLLVNKRRLVVSVGFNGLIFLRPDVKRIGNVLRIGGDGLVLLEESVLPLDNFVESRYTEAYHDQRTSQSEVG